MFYFSVNILLLGMLLYELTEMFPNKFKPIKRTIFIPVKTYKYKKRKVRIKFRRTAISKRDLSIYDIKLQIRSILNNTSVENRSKILDLLRHQPYCGDEKSFYKAVLEYAKVL